MVLFSLCPSFVIFLNNYMLLVVTENVHLPFGSAALDWL